MPVAFVGHGSPMNVFDDRFAAEMRAWSAGMPKPRALLVVSAHWESRGLETGAIETRPLMYDFGGFPAELSRTQYAPPGAPALEMRVHELLSRRWAPSRDAARPWDHGVWVPLLHMYPQHDVPVLQVSMPWRWTPSQMFEFGQQLAPLRQLGVLVLAYFS
jgi:4,5-DOPA dioxygenase extradiol